MDTTLLDAAELTAKQVRSAVSALWDAHYAARGGDAGHAARERGDAPDTRLLPPNVEDLLRQIDATASQLQYAIAAITPTDNSDGFWTDDKPNE